MSSRQEIYDDVLEKGASWVYHPSSTSSILGGFSEAYGAVDEVITMKPDAEGSKFNSIPVSKITNQEIQHYLGENSRYTGSLNEALENHGWAGIWDAEAPENARAWGLTEKEAADLEYRIVNSIDTSL